jgi:hypothetical protein
MDHLVGSHHHLPGFMLHHNSHSMEVKELGTEKG